MLTKDQILGAKDLKKKKVKIPEWGDEVYVSEMSGFMRSQFEFAFTGDTKEWAKKNVAGLYAVYSVVEENGDLMFSPDDVEDLMKKNGRALDIISQESEKLNRIFTNVEDEAKNS